MKRFPLLILLFLVVATVYLVNTKLSYLRLKASEVVIIPSPTLINSEENKSNPTSDLETILGATSLPSRKVYLGFWTQGFWDDVKKELHVEKLKETERMIGKKSAIAHYYRGWEFLDSSAILSELQNIDQNGWRPMISANPYFFDRCLVKNVSIYQAIAKGNCDSFLKSVGVNLKKFAKPVFLRFAWEMNLPNIEWGLIQAKSTPADFIAAWRHFHDIVRMEGAANVLWVFSPNVEISESIPYKEIYPGDDYVDWLGLDGYNWGTTQPYSRWQSFSQVFQGSYNRLTSLAPAKPLMLAEINSTHIGGDKAAWYLDAFGTQIPHNFPKVAAVVVYNEDRTQKENVNWLIDNSQESLESIKSSLNLPIYLSNF